MGAWGEGVFAQAVLDQSLVQILVIVAIIQLRLLKTEVEKVSM